MGLYLNSDEPMEMYGQLVVSPYFVDKSNIISELNKLINTSSNYICITRPRRFGKSSIASMIGAYYSKAVDSSKIFENLSIVQDIDFMTHLNQHNVIYIDFSEVEDNCSDYDKYIGSIKSGIKDDLYSHFPNVEFKKNESITKDLKRIKQETGEQFVFVLDEWDAVFHMTFITEKDREKYLIFLKTLLKGKGYVSLVYMTGILPIAKYSSGSELNMFAEYNIISKERYSEYFGFTETEVDTLFYKYTQLVPSIKVTREGLRLWYDGYLTLSGERLYNPRSIVMSLSDNQLADYWTSSGPYDEIFYYINHNVKGVRDDIASMIAGIPVSANIKEYAAVSRQLMTRDQILSAMVVYGFLTCDSGMIKIPNKELMDKFADMVMKEESLGYIYNLAKESENMLTATLNGDTATMERILQHAHDTETSQLGYNSETELSAVVKLVYLSSRDKYDIQREDKAGVGYVDYIFYPIIDRSSDCIILELKVDHTAADAIEQIKDRKYIQRFIGKLGEEPKYTGRILAVGMAYQKKDSSKQHECRVEILREAI